MYKCNIEVDIIPRDANAVISYGINERKQLSVTSPLTLKCHNTLDVGNYSFEIEMHNDAVFDIKSVRINNLQDYQFIYVSEYTPYYPEPWYSQQNPRWPDVLRHHTNICWPGVWRIKLESPVFPWIHRTLNLGWIY